MSTPGVSVQTVAVVAVAGAVAFYVWKKGGVKQAANAVGAAIVTAAGAAASGGVGAVAAAVGLPTPDDTTTDPRVARWLIDNAGFWEASKWVGVPALLAGGNMPRGTGTPPAPGTALARAFPNYATYDETDRLAARYPAPDPRLTARTDDFTDPAKYGLGM